MSDEIVPLSLRLVILVGHGAGCIVQDVVYPATPTLEKVHADVGLLAARNGVDVGLEGVHRMLQRMGRVVKGPGAPGVQVSEGRVVVLGEVVLVLDLVGEGAAEGWKREVAEVGRREIGRAHV